MTTDSTSQEPRRDLEGAKSFDILPLSVEVRRALDEMKWEKPTPVQVAVWEPAAAGRDVVVQARTGTGKTAAYGLPIVDRIVRRAQKGVQALVLCPTRELALQVSREVQKLGEHKQVTTVAIYGGAPMQRQIDAIEHGAQVVIGTPGRVLDHLRRGTLDPGQVRVLVLDEADEMLSMGFERELTAILEQLPPARQTLLFSATIPPDIERMAKTRLREPEFVILSSDQVGALEIIHYVYWVYDDKPRALVEVLDYEDPESAIVFCNTREETERVAGMLKREGFQSDWLNGDLPQSDREKVMRRTREGRLRFLVATDVAARGIDISHLTHVINYDFPQDAESYVHRTGRTGRAGKTGTAVSLVTPKEVGGLYILRLTYKIRPIERHLPNALEKQTRVEADVLRSLCDTFAARGKDARYRSLARRLLSHDDAESILAGMLGQQLALQQETSEVAASRRRARNPEPAASVPEAPPPRQPAPPPRQPAPPAPPPAAAEAPPPRASSPRGSAPTGPVPEREPRREPPREQAPRREPPREPRREPPREPAPRREPPREPPPPETPRVDAPRSDGERPRRVKASRAPRPVPGGDPDRGGHEAVEAERMPRVVASAAPERAPRATPDAPERAPSPPRRDDDDDDDDGDDKAPRHENAVELHVDVGRRDGARARHLKGILADGGIAPELVYRVRVRDRYCFVEVDRSIADAALEVLGGGRVGDKTIRATISARSGR
jgi:ATP-dependent RNA helicase DeaD